MNKTKGFEVCTPNSLLKDPEASLSHLPLDSYLHPQTKLSLPGPDTFRFSDITFLPREDKVIFFFFLKPQDYLAKIIYSSKIEDKRVTIRHPSTLDTLYLTSETKMGGKTQSHNGVRFTYIIKNRMDIVFSKLLYFDTFKIVRLQSDLTKSLLQHKRYLQMN